MSETNCSNIIDAMWCFAAATFALSFPSTLLLLFGSIQNLNQTTERLTYELKIENVYTYNKKYKKNEPASQNNHPAMSGLKKIHK